MYHTHTNIQNILVHSLPMQRIGSMATVSVDAIVQAMEVTVTVQAMKANAAVQAMEADTALQNKRWKFVQVHVSCCNPHSLQHVSIQMQWWHTSSDVTLCMRMQHITSDT